MAVSGSGCEVNYLLRGLLGEAFPTVDLAHGDLPGGEQRPEQHCRGLGRRQNGLRLDPPLELLVLPFNGVRGPRRFPLLVWTAPDGIDGARMRFAEPQTRETVRGTD